MCACVLCRAKVHCTAQARACQCSVLDRTARRRTRVTVHFFPISAQLHVWLCPQLLQFTSTVVTTNCMRPNNNNNMLLYLCWLLYFTAFYVGMALCIFSLAPVQWALCCLRQMAIALVTGFLSALYMRATTRAVQCTARQLQCSGGTQPVQCVGTTDGGDTIGNATLYFFSRPGRCPMRHCFYVGTLTLQSSRSNSTPQFCLYPPSKSQPRVKFCTPSSGLLGEMLMKLLICTPLNLSLAKIPVPPGGYCSSYSTVRAPFLTPPPLTSDNWCRTY